MAKRKKMSKVVDVDAVEADAIAKSGPGEVQVTDPVEDEVTFHEPVPAGAEERSPQNLPTTSAVRAFSFGEAIRRCYRLRRVSRLAWLQNDAVLPELYYDREEKLINIDFKTGDAKSSMHFVPEPEDIVANDYYVVS